MIKLIKIVLLTLIFFIPAFMVFLNLIVCVLTWRFELMSFEMLDKYSDYFIKTLKQD